MSQQSAMTNDDAPQADAPVIVFTMPSLRDGGDTSTPERPTVGDGASPFTELVERAMQAVEGDVQVDESEPAPTPVETPAAELPVANVLPDGSFAPPSPDTRAEYMYALIEEERQRILAAAGPQTSLLDRLRQRKK